VTFSEGDQPQRHRERGDGRSEMGDRVSTAGADFLADAPPLKRLVLRRRSLAAKERKEREADTFTSLSFLCSFAAGNRIGRVRSAIAVRGRKPPERSRAGVGGFRGRDCRKSPPCGSCGLPKRADFRMITSDHPRRICQDRPQTGLFRLGSFGSRGVSSGSSSRFVWSRSLTSRRAPCWLESSPTRL